MKNCKAFSSVNRKPNSNVGKQTLKALLVFSSFFVVGYFTMLLWFNSRFLSEVPYLPSVLGPVVFSLYPDISVVGIISSICIIIFIRAGLLALNKNAKRIFYIIAGIIWLVVGLYGWILLSYSA